MSTRKIKTELIRKAIPFINVEYLRGNGSTTSGEYIFDFDPLVEQQLIERSKNQLTHDDFKYAVFTSIEDALEYVDTLPALHPLIWISANEQIQVGSEQWQRVLSETDCISDMGSDFTVLASGAVKAKNNSSTCTFCLNPTPSGTYVRVMSILVDGEIISHRYCQDCCNAMILGEYITDSQGYHEGHPSYNEDDDNDAWGVREEVRAANKQRSKTHA